MLSTGEWLGYMPWPEPEGFDKVMVKSLHPSLYNKSTSSNDGIFAYCWVNQIHVYSYWKTYPNDTLKINLAKISKL